MNENELLERIQQLETALEEKDLEIDFLNTIAQDHLGELRDGIPDGVLDLLERAGMSVADQIRYLEANREEILASVVALEETEPEPEEEPKPKAGGIPETPKRRGFGRWDRMIAQRRKGDKKARESQRQFISNWL